MYIYLQPSGIYGVDEPPAPTSYTYTAVMALAIGGSTVHA